MNDITLSYLLHLALKRIWAIVFVAIIFACCGFGYCTFASSPIYKSTGSILVTNGALVSQSTASGQYSSKISSTDIVASLNLVDTISDILNTSGIYKELSEKTSKKYSYQKLQSLCTVKRRGESTLLIDVSFQVNNADESKKLVNLFLDIAPTYIAKYLPDSNASIATTADSASLIYPRTTFTTFVAGLMGAVLTFVVIFIIDTSDHAIKSEEDFKSTFKIPLLGTVPDFKNSGVTDSEKGGYTYADKR